MSQTAKQKADEKAWQAKQDMRTLAEARAIEADKTRHTAAKQSAQEDIKKLQSITNKPSKPLPKRK